MENIVEKKLEEYKTILNKLEYNENDVRNNKKISGLIGNMLKNDIIKVSKLYTDLNGEPKEGLLGFVLKIDFNFTDFPNAILYTGTGVIEATSTYNGYGIVSFTRVISRKACEVINKIISGKLGLKKEETNVLSFKRKNKSIATEEESVKINKIKDELNTYENALYVFKYSMNRKDIDELVKRTLENDVIKKSKMCISAYGEIRERLLGFVLTLSSEYSDIYFDTERCCVETMLSLKNNENYSFNRKLYDKACMAMDEFISDKFKVKDDEIIGYLFD